MSDPVPHASTTCLEHHAETGLAPEHNQQQQQLTCTPTTTAAPAAVPCRLAKRSPRREHQLNRRTRSMYSSHVSALATPERKPLEPLVRRVAAKGLLERRGSSASLTIDLAAAAASPESPPAHHHHIVVTPTRERTIEEFLLSAGNSMSRQQLRKAVAEPVLLHKEFWEVPLNYPEELDVCGSSVKNRYRTVLPNPRSRVVLPGSDDPLATYINANYVRVSVCIG